MKVLKKVVVVHNICFKISPHVSFAGKLNSFKVKKFHKCKKHQISEIERYYYIKGVPKREDLTNLARSLGLSRNCVKKRFLKLCKKNTDCEAERLWGEYNENTCMHIFADLSLYIAL